ncbi:MAG: hypothetical protein HOA84_04290 [Candidatus Jacksonbacteria bacterium]|nr:hypothetical protein [Candidatus Jacksonbacteria bacterium]
MRRIIFASAFLLTLYGCFMSSYNLNNVEQWFILLDYNPGHYTLDAEEASVYDLAILDPDEHPPLEDLSKLILIAYVSLGEAETYRSYWKNVYDKDFIIEENPYWEGNYLVDVRNTSWRATIIEGVIPELLEKGFKGIMMVTIDTASFLESEDHEKFRGSADAMVSFVKEIHERYPDLFLISNNGFEVLDDIAPYISGMLVESIYMSYNPDTEEDIAVSEEDREYKLYYLQRLQEEYKLPVFAVDYISSDDMPLIRDTAERLRLLGFKPYIAKRGLKELYKN